MRLRPERVHVLSVAIVDRLTKNRFVEPRLGREDLIRRVEHAVTQDLMVEDRLNEEVRELLKANEAKMAQGSLDYHTMFLLVKNKLVKERALIL